MNYYEVHIFLGRNDGYSTFFESDKFLEDENDIINEALKVIPHIQDDIDMCDYATKITEQEYRECTGK